MYHIKDDKRARASAALIYDGLISCLRRKPFESITISDILNESGVGRATFYRHFDNLADVLYMRCDACFSEVLNGFIRECEGGNEAPGDFLVYFFRYWMGHYELLETLTAINRLDIVYKSHFEHSRVITAYFLPDQDMESEDYIYFMSVRTSIMVGVLSSWVKTRRRKTPEELVRLIADCTGSALRSGMLL